MLLITLVLAAVLFVCFATFVGKASGFEDVGPQLESPVLEDTEIVASVREKYIAPGGSVRATCWAVFACDDGVAREFMLDKEAFDALYIGQRDTLIYSGAMFLGFGACGGTDIDDEEAADIQNADDFSHDDFDESIDIEQSIDLSNGADQDLSDEDRTALALFLDYGKLPEKSEQLADEADSIAGLKAEKLLQEVTIYPFLKREEKLVRMFERTYRDAVEDMRGYDGDSRQGQAADDIFLNGNSIRLVITVQELPPPLRCTVTAELGVND